MPDLFQQFSKTSKEDWISIIHKELKGDDPAVLMKSSEIEEIELPAYFHQSDAVNQLSDPGQFPFLRGTDAHSNNWNISTVFSLSTATNQEILDALMSGTEALFLYDDTKNAVDFAKLLAGVQLEYVALTLKTPSAENAEKLLEFAYQYEVTIITPNTDEWIRTAEKYLSKNTRPFCIDAGAIKSAGANTWQEAGIALVEGHDLLVRLESLRGHQKAVQPIAFFMGTGSRYFFEIAKIRSFRACWATIAQAYYPEMTEADLHISAGTGFMEISLQDPYTNLLRQTTQAMSAALAGASELTVFPYDLHSDSPQTNFTRRMATNISLLLKDESFFSIVADPAGGAYVIEKLTAEITKKAWQLFLQTEKNGGLTAGEKKRLAGLVSETARKRIDRLNEGKDKLIGVNIFPNPEKSTSSWKPLPEAWNGLPMLVLEKEYNAAR